MTVLLRTAVEEATGGSCRTSPPDDPDDEDELLRPPDDLRAPFRSEARAAAAAAPPASMPASRFSMDREELRDCSTDRDWNGELNGDIASDMIIL